MTIKEVEQQTGLNRSNIRFYEKERLIESERNASNGYRDYSAEDVDTLKKIAYLRTLEISIVDIRKIQSGEEPLKAVLEKQIHIIGQHMESLAKAQRLCEKMLTEENLCFENLQIEAYTGDAANYFKAHPAVFLADCRGFAKLWGRRAVWGTITALCLITALLSYGRLPENIPVQWSGGSATAFMGKWFIFAYPLACTLIRLFLRPVVISRWFMNMPCKEAVTDYLINSLCLILLTAQVFTLLYLLGLVGNIAVLILGVTAVLVGLLIPGMVQFAPGSIE